MSKLYEQFAEVGILIYATFAMVLLIRLAWLSRRTPAWASPRAHTLRNLNRAFLIAVMLLPGAFAAYFYWLRPSGSSAIHELRFAPARTRTLVFVHGWMGGDVTWSDFPHLAASDPRFAAFNILVVQFPTFLVGKNIDIGQTSDVLRAQLSAKAKDHELYLIAHSMGGIIARQFVIQDRLAQTHLAIRAIISIATPYLGADVAKLGFELGIAPEQLYDLKAGSSFLNQQAISWRELVSGAPSSSSLKTFCIGSVADRIVKPPSAISQCGDFKVVSEWGHRELAKPTAISDLRYALPTAWLIEHW